MATVNFVASIAGPWLTSPVEIHNLQETDGKKFMKLIKGCGRINRMLSGKSAREQRALCKTTFMQSLVSARNEHRATLLKRLEAAVDGSAVDDLGPCDKPPSKKSRVDLLLDTIEVDVDIEGLPPNRMCMLTSDPSSPAWVEVTPENVEWMHTATDHQLTIDRPASEKKATQEKEKGIWLDCSRHAWRVRFCDSGKKRFKDFSFTADDAESKGKALTLAEEFVLSQA